MDAVSRSMAERTGRTVEQWVALVQTEGPDPLDQRAVRAWLRDVHGLPQNSQWTVASAAAVAAGWVEPTVEGHTDALYSGAKADLRPLHDAVIALALALGDDVEVQGRATYLPVVRHRQMMAVAPGPRRTLRVGLRYGADAPDDPRLSPATGFAQATHWVHLPVDTPVAEVDALAPLLRQAYDQN